MENRRSQTSFWKNRDEQRTEGPFSKPLVSKTKNIDNSDMTSRPNVECWQRNHGANCGCPLCSAAWVDCYHSSKQDKFFPEHGDPHYKPEEYTSSSDSGDDKIQTREATSYNFEKQRFREEIDRNIPVKLMTCKGERKVSSPVLKNSTMEVNTGRNEMNETEAPREDVFMRQLSSDETKPFHASRNNDRMEVKDKRGKMREVGQLTIIAGNRTADNQNSFPVRWKASASEKTLSLEKDLLGYFKQRTVSIHEGNISVDIIESKMQLQTDLGNVESLVKWKTPTHTSPLGNVPPFRGFSQFAGDSSVRISNCDNVERTEPLQYHTDLSRERDRRCTSMNKNKGEKKDYFETAENDRSSDENINYAKTFSQAEKIISSKNYGQKEHFQQRKHLVQERENFRSSSLSHSEDSDIQRNSVKTENEDRVRMKPFCSKERHYDDRCDKRSATRTSTRSRDTDGNQRKNAQHSTKLHTESFNLQSVDGLGANAYRNESLQSSFQQEQKGQQSYDGVRKKSNFMLKENLKNQDLNDNGEKMYTRRDGHDTPKNHRRSLQNRRNIPHRSSARDSILCQEKNEKSPGVTEVFSFNNRSLSGETDKQHLSEIKGKEAYVREGNSMDLVKNLSELIEKLSVLVEGHSVPPRKDHHVLHTKQKPQTITPSRLHLQDIHPLQKDPQYIKSLHETEMYAAQNAVVTSLKEHGGRLNQSMLTSHMVLQIFRATYKVWLKAREITLTMLKSLNKECSQNNSWQNSLKTIFAIVKAGGKWASQILPFTPYAASPVASVMQLVPMIADQAEKLILPEEGTQELREFQTDIALIVQQDIQLSSDFEEFSLQCETQFKETVNLFFEFQSIICREQMADFVGDEDIDLLNFLIEWSAAGPELSNFVQQISDAYMRYHNTTDRGPANAQAIFCSFIDHDPSALNTIRCLDWNFTEVFQCRTPDGDLSSCWKDVRKMISHTNGNSAANVSDMIVILETQKRNVIQNVSKLFQGSRGPNANDY